MESGIWNQETEIGNSEKVGKKKEKKRQQGEEAKRQKKRRAGTQETQWIEMSQGEWKREM